MDLTSTPGKRLRPAVVPALAAALLSLLTPLCAHALPSASASVEQISTAAAADTHEDLPIYKAGALPLDLQPPFVVEGAEVTGVADADARAEFTAAGDEGRRVLLHGRRRPSSYTLCPRCTILTCEAGSEHCSGHCKDSRHLYKCRTRNSSGGYCYTPVEERPDPETLPADRMEALDSAVMTATAPFIGCANITGVPDGCPPSGMRGHLNGVGGFKILSSYCVQHKYSLTCAADDPTRTPFYPFGFCQCLIFFDAGNVGTGPCRMSYLDWSGPGEAGGGPDAPVRVFEERGRTHTTFGVTEPGDVMVYEFNFKHHFADAMEGPIDVTLQHFSSLATEGYDLVEESPL